METGKVVMVDDSEICRDFVTMVLEERGYKVIAVGSPLGFSKVLRDERPDLALVDVTMPALRGDKLVELARRGGGVVCPIVLYSDRPVAELDGLVQACGAVGYICKNDNEKALADSVKKFIQKFRAAPA